MVGSLPSCLCGEGKSHLPGSNRNDWRSAFLIHWEDWLAIKKSNDLYVQSQQQIPVGNHFHLPLANFLRGQWSCFVAGWVSWTSSWVQGAALSYWCLSEHHAMQVVECILLKIWQLVSHLFFRKCCSKLLELGKFNPSRWEDFRTSVLTVIYS